MLSQTIFPFRYAVVTGQHKCAKCDSLLLSRAFYLYPCGHKFHADCLVKEVRMCHCSINSYYFSSKVKYLHFTHLQLKGALSNLKKGLQMQHKMYIGSGTTIDIFGQVGRLWDFYLCVILLIMRLSGKDVAQMQWLTD